MKYLKGSESNELHPLLCTTSYNIRLLLRMIVRKAPAFLVPMQTTALSLLPQKLADTIKLN